MRAAHPSCAARRAQLRALPARPLTPGDTRSTTRAIPGPESAKNAVAKSTAVSIKAGSIVREPHHISYGSSRASRELEQDFHLCAEATTTAARAIETPVS